MVGEIPLGAEGCELGGNDGVDVAARVFEVDQKHECACGIGHEDTVLWASGRGCGELVWSVLEIEELDKRINVHGAESTVFGESISTVTHEQVVIEEPDVGFDTGATVTEGLEEWNTAPVVVVRMATNWIHVSSQIGEFGRIVFGGRIEGPSIKEFIFRFVPDWVDVGHADVYQMRNAKKA